MTDLEASAVQGAWNDAHERPATDDDIERWYVAFEKVSGTEASTFEGRARIYWRFIAALAAVSSGEPFHESRYREHDDEGNHIWDHPVSPAPVPAAGLPPPDPSLIGTEYHPISIDGGRYRPPITEEIRLLRQRFPEVVAAIEAAAVRERDELREALEGVVADIGRMKACAPDGDYIRWDVEHADPSLHYVNREGVIQRLRAALHREDGA